MNVLFSILFLGIFFIIGKANKFRFKNVKGQLSYLSLYMSISEMITFNSGRMFFNFYLSAVLTVLKLIIFVFLGIVAIACINNEKSKGNTKKASGSNIRVYKKANMDCIENASKAC